MGAGMAGRAATFLTVLVAAVGLTACDDVFFHEAADEGVPIRVSYGLANSVAGLSTPEEDFDAADEAHLRIRSGSSVLVDRVVALDPADNGLDKVARVEVPVGEEPISVSVEATLLVEGRAVLEGFRSFEIDPDSDVPPRADLVLLPILDEGQTRIVLSWGAEPRDLDSHMTGPDGQGGQFHVHFVDRGSATEPPFVSLDTDDTQGFGPETITIWQQQPGVYCYSVHNFSGSPALSTAEATVEVFQGDALARSYDVPGGTGRVWTVFSLSTDGIATIDRIVEGPPPGVCQ